jgi:hypothetical protein
MDARTIAGELGVTAYAAQTIVRWCAKRKGVVRPEGIRKLYVYREDVEAWLASNTRSAA